MKAFMAFVLIYLCINPGQAQELNSSGARSEALANSTGASIDFWSLKNNPSTIAFLNETSAGIDVKNNFMVKELSSATIAILLPVNKYGVFSFYYQRYGYKNFNQNKVAISYSKKISKQTSASIQLNNNIQNIVSEEESYTEHIIGFNIGVFTKLNENFHLASYYNFKKNISDRKENNAQELSLALSWFPISELNILSEISLKTNSKTFVGGGVEYLILDKVAARIGISSEPLNISMGIGIFFRDLNIDISATHNQYLGTGSNLSGNYVFN
ncbi:MAG: hypothetical protein ABFR62_04770 [Bacteroidota bacterium]